MPRKRSEPTIEMRRHRLADGSQTKTYSVRYVDTAGKRRRTSFPTLEEADFERARLLLEQTRAGDPLVAPAVVVPQAVGEGSTRLAEFWQVWLADARSRLSPRTLENHEAQWRTRVGPAFGHLPLVAIRPRLVAQWRAALLADGAGPGAVGKAMGLLQTMFTLAVEWGKADANPVSVVRKPRQGPKRAVAPIAPEDVEAVPAVLLRDGDGRSATMVSVMAYAGLRPREALGLEWRHLWSGSGGRQPSRADTWERAERTSGVGGGWVRRSPGRD